MIASSAALDPKFFRECWAELAQDHALKEVRIRNVLDEALAEYGLKRRQITPTVLRQIEARLHVEYEASLTTRQEYLEVLALGIGADC